MKWDVKKKQIHLMGGGKHQHEDGVNHTTPLLPSTHVSVRTTSMFDQSQQMQ